MVYIHSIRDKEQSDLNLFFDRFNQITFIEIIQIIW
jgi:hypothetical protein